jgi:hypothetical protein
LTAGDEELVHAVGENRMCTTKQNSSLEIPVAAHNGHTYLFYAINREIEIHNIVVQTATPNQEETQQLRPILQ